LEELLMKTRHFAFAGLLALVTVAALVVPATAG
jgi:hypothetical protein